jgi:hypothetical protein
LIYVLASGHETVFEGSQVEGALGRRRRYTHREKVAKTFSVSMTTIKRWLKRRRETGDVQPTAIPGRPSRKGTLLKEWQWLPKHLEANDDLTLEEHTARLSRSTSGRGSPPLPSGGPSPSCPMAALAAQKSHR